jgi:small subunit ribosomal protein S20
MANTKQARKRARQAETHRRHNSSRRSMMRTFMKKVLAAIDAKDKKAAQSAFETFVPVLDRMSAKGIVHKNKAARHKKHLSAQIKALSGDAALMTKHTKKAKPAAKKEAPKAAEKKAPATKTEAKKPAAKAAPKKEAKKAEDK